MSEQLDEGLESALLWLEYADGDLETAPRALTPPVVPVSACFHAQQAAEKSLKAYLAWLSDEPIPRIHDLGVLIALVVQRGGERPDERVAAILTQHAVETRYPPTPPPTPEQAAEAVRQGEDMVQWVRAAMARGPEAKQTPPPETS